MFIRAPESIVFGHKSPEKPCKVRKNRHFAFGSKMLQVRVLSLRPKQKEQGSSLLVLFASNEKDEEPLRFAKADRFALCMQKFKICLGAKQGSESCHFDQNKKSRVGMILLTENL